MHNTTVAKAGPKGGDAQDSIRNMHEQMTLFVMLSSLAMGVNMWKQQYYMKVQMTEGQLPRTNEQPACMLASTEASVCSCCKCK